MTEHTRNNSFVVETHCLGPYQTNCYIIRSIPGPSENQRVWALDFSFEIETVLKRLDEIGSPPESLVLTHAHVDHIAGLADTKRAYPDAPVLQHTDEQDWLTDANRNLSGFSPTPVTAQPADRLLSDGEEIELAGQTWKVLHTPGHSPGSISLYHAESATCFCGDAVFKGSVGRTDFPGCSFETLEHSIRTKIYTLPDDTLLLPGHGPATTVGDEKKHNQYVPG